MSMPFSQVKILDFTRYLAGPFATFQFAVLGADVIKVESLEGDPTRKTTIDRALADAKMSPTFLAMNPNKRSLALDLNSPEGVSIIRSLIKDVDVVCENFRPGVMKRLGLGYDALKALNPRLIYCSISGFGHSGPEQYTAAFDGKIQAMSGMMAMTGDPAGGPMRTGFAVCDLIAGMTGAFAISSALYERENTGQGGFLDVSMLDSALVFLASQVCEATMGGVKHTQMGNLSVSRKVTANRFRTGDGDIVLAVLNEKHFAKLMVTLGIPQALDDPRFTDWFTRTEHEPALRGMIETAMAPHNASYWEQTLTAADIPCGMVRRLDEIIQHPQLEHRAVLQTVKTPKGEFRMAGAGFQWQDKTPTLETCAPLLGQHTDEILQQAGYSAAQIRQFRDRGTLGPATAESAAAAGPEGRN
ncbi:CoA transferase [Verticiella sediminum]|uniref:CoA transferase n=1 Tax=Verticiella sediminum TaxID=1247510 RepID=A0A556B1B0_9BURK|nr:CoA transferase [Verticiella sediminum]TSH98981.1 CoA transferase [Verticiella sediminum]